MANTRRKLYIIGAIDWENYKVFSEALDELEQESKKPVEIELASDGGDAHAALAFNDKIRNSKCDILITGTGSVASAAVLILASGDYRQLTRAAWVMVHEESARYEHPLSVSEQERETKQARILETQWNKLLGGMTEASPEYWGKLHKETTYLSAQDCLALGLIDRII